MHSFECIATSSTNWRSDMSRSLRTIAIEVAQDWKKVNFAAVPYVEAMFTRDQVSDEYGADSGRAIVL